MMLCNLQFETQSGLSVGQMGSSEVKIEILRDRVVVFHLVRQTYCTKMPAVLKSSSALHLLPFLASSLLPMMLPYSTSPTAAATRCGQPPRRAAVAEVDHQRARRHLLRPPVGAHRLLL